MEPFAPIAKIAGWGPGSLIATAGLLGVGFGFVLERGGFGNARVLAGQWYGYNFAVLRVMFTAILVAMLGIFGLHYLGAMDLSLVYVNETWLWPQLAGGLIFGFGFVVGQYCPGTAVVACATGKIDGMAYVAGFGAGVVAFFFAYPAVARFYESSAMGRVMLPDLLHLPAGVVALTVVAIALGAFAFTHFLDRKLGDGRAPDAAP
jgi:uncharacterized membrane protein YedE/YeeE